MINAKTWLQSWMRTGIDEKEFENLYQSHLPLIYNFFRYRVGDGPLAEDLTAQTFEKAWRKRHRYRNDLASLATWLFTIARRVAIDHYRQQKAFVPLDDIRDLASDDSPEADVQKAADFDRLTRLLNQLDDRSRELVALRYGAGLTNRAIADLAGLSESNVGVILHRAVKKLRAGWEETS